MTSDTYTRDDADIVGALGRLHAELTALREWKASVLGLLTHYGLADTEWAGDKTGWGAAFEFIKAGFEGRLRRPPAPDAPS